MQAPDGASKTGASQIKACADGSPPLAFDGDNIIRALNWRIRQGPGLDDPLIALAGTGPDGPKELYYVTDGAGRQYAVAEGTGGLSFAILAGADAYAGYKASGAVTNSHSYGEARLSQPNAPGLSFFRNRVYDQETGRWTQEDPIGLAGGINLYQFNGNDPATYSDPYGLCPPCAAVYAAFEVGATLYDLFDLGKATVGFARGTVSKTELGITAAGVGAGVIGFGGGYGKIGRETASRLMRDIADNPDNWRVVGTFTEAATNKKARGGLSMQTIVENQAGDRMVRHTVVDKSGKVIDDHYRPIFKSRDVDQP